MTPKLVVRPASKGSSTISHDDIPPQPLDLDHQAESPDSLSHDFPPRLNYQPESPATIRSNHQRPDAIAFHKLPEKAISKILWSVEAGDFASLAILNRAWYQVAQDRELYAHHLSRCPSYALANTVITGPFRKNDLYRLKTKFAAEVRRNLFQAYLRPRQTLINLISVNASSSAALPGAEAFRFAFSPNGQTILALSSSRIYVIDATTDPVVVRKELKTQRRPLSASVTDDGTILAVLSSRHQANIYNIGPEGVKHVQVLVMDNPPRTIALAPEGTVLAAAYEGGVEVFSLAPSALSTDRRAVRSEGVDVLSFSGDGSMLVGSTQSLEEPSSVVITAPFYTENDLPAKEIHSRMWTTQILFPQISSICSHAELLQGHSEGDANWLFAYDHTLMSYRAVRTDDTRTGVAYFLNPSSTRRFSLPAPSTAPTATVCGTLVVAGFSGSGLWIYGVPEKLDVSPDMGSVVERHEQRLQGRGGVALTSATGHLEPLMAYSPSVSGSSEDFEDDSIAAKVDWRESLFVKCEQIRSIDGCTAVKWVEKSDDRPCAFAGKRLVVVAPGGVDQFMEELGDETMPVDGSRVSILDFDYSPSTKADREITIEVGEEEPELLTEQIGDMDIEVAMERRRTVRARGGRGMPLGRSVTTVSPSQGLWGQRRTSSSQPSSPLDVDAQIERAQAEAARSPRTPSSATLHRSATAAGFTTARYPPRPPLSAQGEDTGHVMYHRSPGQMYPPGDGWESPPPPYSNTHGQAQPHPSFLLGSPLVQPRQASGPGPMPMPLLGIPENGGGSSRGQSRPISPGYSAHQIPPVPQPPAQFTSHNTPFSPSTVSPITPLTANGINAPPSLAGYGPVPQRNFSGPSSISSAVPNISIPVSNPAFVPPTMPVSRDSSSRPVSHEGGPSPFHTPISQRNQTSDRPSPLNLDRAPQNPFDASNITQNQQQAQNRLSASSITLTGANLQARLNHPVPPTPTTLEQMRSSQEGQRRAPTPNSGGPMQQAPPASYSLGPAPGEQVAHLNRHLSQAQRKPVPHASTNGGAYPNQNNAIRDFSGNVAGQPGPGRGPWGPMPVGGPSVFPKPISLPNGEVRHAPRGGGGPPIPMSSSTPNLLAGMPANDQRPTMGRLETIDSAPGSAGRGDSRSHNGAQGFLPSPVGVMNSLQPHLHPHAHVHAQSYSQPPYLQPQPQIPGGWIGNNDRPDMQGRRVSSDPTALETPSKKKKGKRKKGEPIAEPGRSQTPMPMSNSSAPAQGKKGSRCVVM